MKLAGICATLLILVAGTLGSDPHGEEAVKEKVDAYAMSYAKTGDFSGCILIRKAEETLYKGCFGKASYRFGLQNTISTKFKIGSISKQITASAILLLEEDGKLETTDLLSEHLGKTGPSDRITIHHLLTHTSGLVDIFALPNFRKINRKSLSLEEVTAEIFGNDLVSEPGKTYAYSNSGYTVLARIIEKVSGKSYGDFLEERIFGPLKMSSTGDYFDGPVIENLAEGYDPAGYDGVTRPEYVNDVFFRGSGSIYSSVGDVEKWVNALRDGKILKSASQKKLFTEHSGGYGYGISIYRSNENDVFGHDGRISGYIADYLHYRQEDVTIIILGNLQTGVADFLRRDLAAIVFGKEYKSRAKSTPARGNYPEGFEKLAGKYEFAPTLSVYVDVLDGKLKARANEGSYSEMVPLTDGKYFSRMLYSYIDFRTDDEGVPTTMIWINNDGNKFEGKKTE
ncbi:MAG: class A beta-lactamase-related serine hydrolase [Acidobacteria bacterium]|nr:MAG: class A beta-lactamase-related serine hydrolase [Acidobacteriota bacterium]REJ98039.1 MAG: class A beta-lactamase-related serine hydrolase [Acidobacteriota bacterium]REK16782.1 MAG: class A beta-lactamase-related serine hydrolase [Acidobacteriota bacterium]REK42693.1 MAG: class A beta-lactamase-related serine hydrolase [Acidobacteriota bacterium]